MKELILDYEEVLIGNRDAISSFNFYGAEPGGNNQKRALECIRFVIENILQWNLDQAKLNFDTYMIQLMKLDRIIEYIVYPPEVCPGDTLYILSLLYPDKIRMNPKTMIENMYQRVLDGEAQFPREYFLGQKGFYRFCVCLCYLISEYRPFGDMEEIYQFFSSPEGKVFLDENRLRVPMEHLGIDLLKCIQTITQSEKYSYLFYCYYEFQKKFSNAVSQTM